MVGMNARLNIISYALVSYKFNEGKDILNSYVPLIENLLLMNNYETISKNDLVEEFKRIYGYTINKSLINDLLKILFKQKKIEFLKGDLIYIDKEKIKNYEDEEDCNLAISALTNELILFLKTKDIQIERYDLLNKLIIFLNENSVEVNSFFLNKSNLDEKSYKLKEESDRDEDRIEKYLIEFLLNERSKNSKFYETLQDIYAGVILTSLIQYGKEEIEKFESEDIKLKNVLLDSNYIFRLLNLQTTFEYQASIETWELLNKINCNLWVSSTTINQIVCTIQAVMNNYSATTFTFLSNYNSESFSGLISAIIRQRLSKADLQEIINNLENTLRDKFNIKILDSQDENTFEFDKEDICSLRKIKEGKPEESIEHDVNLVYIIRNHRPKHVYKKSQVDWWILTDDYKLAKWCKIKNNVPECLTEAEIAALFWLKKSHKLSGPNLYNNVLALRNKYLYDDKDFLKISKEIDKQRIRYETDNKNREAFSLLLSSNLISTDQIISLTDENADAYFDQQLQKAKEILLEKEQVTEKLESTEEQLKIEKKRFSTIINAELKEHIETLGDYLKTKKDLLALKTKEYQDVKNEIIKIEKRHKRNIIIASISLLLIIGIVILTFELKTDVFNKTDKLLATIPCTFGYIVSISVILLVLIVGTVNKERIIKKIFSSLFKCKLLYGRNKRKKIRLKLKQKMDLCDQITALEKEIKQIEQEIEKRLSQGDLIMQK